MTKAILGTKVGMTQVFTTEGKMHAATILHVEPNVVLQVMSDEKDGYNALKVGYKTVAEKSLNKPELGQFKSTGTPKKFIKEFRNMSGFDKGQEITVELFEAGEYVNAQARTKGHGFTGSIKRHNFKIGPMGHGAGYPHRYVGSVSGGRGGSQAQRVFKGHPLPGHYGNELVTIQNLLVLEVNKDKNYIIVKGAIPGPKGAIITLKNSEKYAGVKEKVNLVNYAPKPVENAENN